MPMVGRLGWISSTIAALPSTAPHLRGVITTQDSCTGDTVTTYGTTTLTIQATEKGVFVREHFSDTEAGFEVDYHGKGLFPTTASTYDIQIAGEWEGPTDFKSSGVDTIFASGNGLTPTGDSFRPLNNVCKSTGASLGCVSHDWI